MTQRVVLLRGRSANPWDLRPWADLGDPYRPAVLVPDVNDFDVGGLAIEQVPVRTISSRMPRGRGGALATQAVGERYLDLEPRLRGAAIVHSAELGYWFSWQAARLKPRLGFRLVLTVWETLPFRRAYRNVRTRRYVPAVLAAADLFLTATERARAALELEGAPPERIVTSPPGIDVGHFAAARRPDPPADGSHVVLSAGRLVWDKGHQDVLRALALLRRSGRSDVRALIVGSGPERKRLHAYAGDLGVGDAVEWAGSVPYERMPEIYARASCLVLASLPAVYWEEQFGMVLAEAMAAHVPIVAAASGAIPEVVGGSGTLFRPGDWIALAEALAAGPLARTPGTRQAPEPERLERFGAAAATQRLRAAYDELLA